MLRLLGQQNIHGLLHALHLKHPILHILFLRAHPGAAQHQPVYPLPKLRRHAVGHEAAVADAGDHHFLDSEGVHEGHDAACLENLRTFRAGGVGVAEEDEVGDVEVEAGGERGDEVVPLPHCVGADAMDEEEGGFGWGVVFGSPAVHDGAIAQIGGGGL